MLLEYNPIIQTIHYKGCDISVLRLDLIHPEISGNKWFKLKYNLQQAKAEHKDTILTFGGAYSNHIAATAFACKFAGMKSIGIIRGEDITDDNQTLALAKKNGMTIIPITRDEYKLKHTESYLKDLEIKYSNSYIIPEGGDNALGEKGCEEILSKETLHYTKIYCACGTQTTFNGIANSLDTKQKLVGINVLKFNATTNKKNAEILDKYHFGGYARHTEALLSFKSWFECTYDIPLDYIYTVKLFYAVFDLIDKNEMEETDKILMVHSGGLQGNSGYEKRYNLNPNRQVNDPVG
jgi:1-aminocyclopropane-1-carboxylate deaminase/D-cysteine desulfhydrase-like pyridoxal-dependent ACC family enzyme